jgi:hypothetical protein
MGHAEMTQIFCKCTPAGGGQLLQPSDSTRTIIKEKELRDPTD